VSFFIWLVYVGFALPLSVIDIQQHRLPNRIVLAFSVAMILVLLINGMSRGSWADVSRGFAGAVLLMSIFIAVALIFPASMGMGDAKLSFPVGLALAWLGWSALWWGMMIAFLIAAVVGVVLLSLRRGTKRSAIAFGPFMLISAPAYGLAASIGAI
jgi:leader peptidase (prepilin peptidase)/N-methyltransferase